MKLIIFKEIKQTKLLETFKGIKYINKRNTSMLNRNVFFFFK